MIIKYSEIVAIIKQNDKHYLAIEKCLLCCEEKLKRDLKEEEKQVITKKIKNIKKRYNKLWRKQGCSSARFMKNHGSWL